MKWRCLNDRFGYCHGAPYFGEEEEKDGWSTSSWVKTCTADPKTCRKYRTHSQIIGGNNGRRKANSS